MDQPDQKKHTHQAKLDDPKTVEPLAQTLIGFCRYLLSEHKQVFFWLFLLGFLVAAADAMVAVFIGELVGLVGQNNRTAAWDTQWPHLLALIIVIGVLRPCLIWADLYWRNTRLIPVVTTRMRWLSHWHVVRQRWSFFQTNSPAQIAHWVMQTPGAIREVAESIIRAVWYLAMYGLTSLVLLASADWKLTLPLLIWFVGYVLLLRWIVPKMRTLANRNAQAYSELMAQLSDVYGNMLTVKLFGVTQSTDTSIQQVLRGHERAQKHQMGAMTTFIASLTWLNTGLLVTTAALGAWLWLQGLIEAQAVAMALPLVWQAASTGGWVAFEVAGIYQNLGEVREGMKLIAAPNPERQTDQTQSSNALKVTQGHISFNDVHFSYGNQPVLNGLSLDIKGGERLGIVGRSGVGKSTLTGLLLCLFDPDQGQICIDNQDLQTLHGESIRAQIAVVSQDTALFERAIRDNLRVAQKHANDDLLWQSLRLACVDDVVATLKDDQNRIGLDAHTGERGSLLSGGQRQRVVLARALLKSSNILILDEATSALDTETERMVMENLVAHTQGQTVISIAHRLSALQTMDRIAVIEDGQVTELGTHAELLKKNGLYANLWHHQSKH
ncbi:ABC transporter ATP-binding protein [Orrella sp. 11846]|uniref:ABC transporter ATP-binding protein n=1 Tax=Orrella sp. 11846 TaxID=3409913 RepID=UPI003B5C1859